MFAISRGHLIALRALAAVGLLVFADLHAARSEEHDVEKIAALVNAHKARIFQYPGGVSLKCTLAPVSDPERFGYDEPMEIALVIKWPRLYVRSDRMDKTLNARDVRESVYNFVEDHSLALSDMEVHIVPGRHPFSSGFFRMFQWLHFAEGYQSYRLNAPNRELTSIPECFAQRKYEIVGPETLDGIECLHVRSPGFDEIWFAMDHGALVHRRELRFTPGGPLRQITQIGGYKAVAPDIWLPERVVADDYYTSDDDSSKHNQVRSSFESVLVDAVLGEVDDAEFDIAFPKGARVTDLINDKEYIHDRPFEEVVARPSRWRSTLLWLNVLAVLTLVSWLLWRRYVKR